MQIKDIAIIIQKRPLKEKSAIITVFTKNHGLYAGVVRDVTGKMSAIYQPGNVVDFTWNARLDEHIGTTKCELLSSNVHFMQNKSKLYALSSILSVTLASLRERSNHNHFFMHLEDYIARGSEPFSFMDYAYLENALLTETGYGLDLGSCAVNGSTSDLAYVSPKSGRAVSRTAGEAYKDKLLKLPECFLNATEPKTSEDFGQVLDLLLYFFQRYIFGKNEPLPRKIFAEHVSKDGSKNI
ncbi:MAG: DNA repair protein RecO [Pseudomonadota bacterium]